MIFRKAVLFIHGFAGGSYDSEDLASYLELNWDFDVYQFTLPGHDRNLSKSTYEEWIQKSEQKVKWLIEKGYTNIYLIGHSMGGVIASYLASKYKQVKKLVLLAPAFHYLNIVNNDINIKEAIKAAPKALEEYSKDELIGRFFKLNITAIGEFMKLVKEYYDYPKNIKCPTLLMHGDKDNIVPKSSVEYVYYNLTNKKKLIYISEVNHEICKSDRKEEIFILIEEFLKYNTKGGVYHI